MTVVWVIIMQEKTVQLMMLSVMTVKKNVDTSRRHAEVST